MTRYILIFNIVSHKRVIAGQGTAVLELFEQTIDEELDAIIAPVGGGGLVSFFA